MIFPVISGVSSYSPNVLGKPANDINEENQQVIITNIIKCQDVKPSEPTLHVYNKPVAICYTDWAVRNLFS